MKSAEKRFKNILHKNQNFSTYLCFSLAIIHQNFSRRRLHENFNKLVDKTDYNQIDKKTILQHLELINKPPEEGKK